eukprot:TRINITY_DN2595_c0_g2_i1.p1 TRINITY_DN2595_c0_g2~~TRINITY_DN2595_c0_g2_i1.p1  ORF type:complete len:651 (+),score=78.63 TRINITY_DN2595_c0_g2_i1:3-1955(+)
MQVSSQQTTGAQASGNRAIPQTGTAIRTEALEADFAKLREMVESGLQMVRHDLNTVLFALFLNVTMKLYDSNQRAAYSFFNEHLKAFSGNQQFQKDINELYQVFNDANKAREMLQALRSNYQTVYLTSFGYNTLMSLIEMGNLVSLQSCFSSKFNVRIAKEPVTEANYLNDYIRTYKDMSEIAEMNSIPILVSNMKEDSDLDIILKLESKKEAGRPEDAAKKLMSRLDRGRKSRSEKSNYDPESTRKQLMEKLTIPQPSYIDARGEFIKAYLDRRTLDETHEPAILGIDLNDTECQVTCVEFERGGSYLLLGYLDGLIVLHKLNPTLNLHTGPKQSVMLEMVEHAFEEGTKTLEVEGAPPHAQDTMAEMMVYRGHESAITSLSALFQQHYFLSASVDTTVRLWCIRSRHCLMIYSGHLSTVWKVRFSPRGYYFATGGSDIFCRVWTTDKATPVRMLHGHTGEITELQFTENGLYVVTAASDRTIRFWEIATGKCVRILFHHQEVVTCLSFSHSGNYLVSGSENGTIIFWDAEEGKALHYLNVAFETSNPNIRDRKESRFTNGVRDVSIAFDESYVLVCTGRRVLYYLISALKNECEGDAFARYTSEDPSKLRFSSVKPTNFVEGVEHDFHSCFLSLRNVGYVAYLSLIHI